ncbi:MAG: hypothetical protein OXH00_10350 [Candidatus Poribacteria bacterium]|nr:hypothetical protein [Candidatus Poribacteria bacterium]
MGLKELLTEIEKQVHEECISKSCSGDGCRVYLTGTPSDRVIVNLECEFEQRKISTKRCDYVLFCGDASRGNLVVVLIELKSGTFKTSTVADQLQSGANFVSEMFGKLPKEANAALNTLEITCVPTLFHGKRIDRFELRELERSKIRFRSRNTAIKRSKGGQAKNLASVLSG